MAVFTLCVLAAEYFLCRVHFDSRIAYWFCYWGGWVLWCNGLQVLGLQGPVSVQQLVDEKNLFLFCAWGGLITLGLPAVLRYSQHEEWMVKILAPIFFSFVGLIGALFASLFVMFSLFLAGYIVTRLLPRQRFQ
jgi:hypothetical protein